MKEHSELIKSDTHRQQERHQLSYNRIPVSIAHLKVAKISLNVCLQNIHNFCFNFTKLKYIIFFSEINLIDYANWTLRNIL